MLNLPQGAVVPYVPAGWPNPRGFVEAVRAAARAGCPAFEVGFPFSDPVADGPVIQRASAQLLERGQTLQQALDLTREAVSASGLPAVAMTYANLVHRRGYGRFVQELREIGGRGLIVPDLPLEEAEELEAACRTHEVALIHLATPTTSSERMAELGRRTRGFLYLVSVKGVTGGRSQLPPELDALVESAVKMSAAPVMVGFGISRAEQVAQVTRRARGVIVGSALLTRMESADTEQLGPVVEEFLRGLHRSTAE